MSVEIKKEIPPLSEFAEAYGYNAPEPLERVNIGSNWKAEKEATLKAHENDLIAYSAVDRHKLTPVRDSDGLTIWEPHFSESVFPSKTALRTKTYAWLRDRDGKKEFYRLVLDILNAEKPEGQDIAGRFWIADLGNNQWNFLHRQVIDAYQSQGLGTAALEIYTNCLQALANEKGEAQTLIANTGQVDVLLFLLKNGFVPDDQKSEMIAQRVLDKDDSLKIVSSPANANGNHWYIFEKNREIDWKEYKSFNDIEKIGNLRINLRKEVQPNQSTVRNWMQWFKSRALTSVSS